MKKIIVFILISCSQIGATSQGLVLFDLCKKNSKIIISKPIFISGRGQSNMVGGSSLDYTQSNNPSYSGSYANIKTFTFYNADGSPNFTPKNEFETLNTTPSYANSGGNTYAKLNPVCITAIALQSYYNVPVYYLNYSVGGTSLTLGDANGWNIHVSGGLNDQSHTYISKCILMMDSIYGSGNWIYLADLWMQGEAGPTTTAAYELAESDFINSLRSAFGNNILFVDGLLTYSSTLNSYYPYVNQAKTNNSVKNTHNILVNNDNCEKVDAYHYTDAGYFQLGQNFANAIKLKLPK